MSFDRHPLIATAWLSLTFAALAVGARAGDLGGVVQGAGGAPIAGATVTLLDSGHETTTGSDGRFRITGLETGSHVVLAEADGYEYALEIARVPKEGEAFIELHLGVIRQYEEFITVTGTPFGRGVDEAYQPAAVLQGVDLAARLQPTLAEMLADQPGLSSTYFGPVASRPIIRGLGGDRIRIMQDGIESGDASAASPDHAVSVDPFAAERVEVIRGPATLLYGSSAVGGVVNVLDNRIPKRSMSEPVTGRFQLHSATADERFSGAVSIDAGNEKFGVHVDAQTRETEDVDTPLGRLVNTASDADGAAVGLSALGEWGHVGVSYGTWKTFYGSPAEDEVSIDLDQQRLDLSASADVNEVLRTVRFRLGQRDYEHVELEGDEVGTRFLSDYLEARADALFSSGDWEGSFGVQYSDRDFEAIGDESFVPFTNTRTLGFFGYGEWRRDRWTVQVGGRYETRDIDPEGGDSRDLDGLSLSVGTRHEWENQVSLTAALTRSVKLPSAEELFSNGPHLATDQFELGDPTLSEEEALTFDIVLRKTGERANVEVAFFYTDFSDFIRLSATGAMEDGLPVFAYAQSGAELSGGEVSFDVGLLREDPHPLRLTFGLEHVRAERSGGVPLPRIPPFEMSVGIRGELNRFWGAGRLTWADEQDRVEPGETPTGDHVLLDIDLGYRWHGQRTVHDFVLSGKNVTDELARRHASYLKDDVPLPGASASFTYRLTF